MSRDEQARLLTLVAAEVADLAVRAFAELGRGELSVSVQQRALLLRDLGTRLWEEEEWGKWGRNPGQPMPVPENDPALLQARRLAGLIVEQLHEGQRSRRARGKDAARGVRSKPQASSRKGKR